ncbi:hypothetical protein [Flavobacterium aestivum]|uniref:hypothetical protein n=1 Tax=Flavobacterium aestivum TaxID=3003257 RepID=UPI0022863568|nr:hypothetical protein [Flavobacterium aestivum]
MFSIFSKPIIASCEEIQDSCILNIQLKSNKCGFINISRERVTFQFSCGWRKFGKGTSKIETVSFKYMNNKLIIFKISNNQEILALECNKSIYDKAFDFLKVKQKERKDPEFRSKSGQFFGR